MKSLIADDVASTLRILASFILVYPFSARDNGEHNFKPRLTKVGTMKSKAIQSTTVTEDTRAKCGLVRPGMYYRAYDSCRLTLNTRLAEKIEVISRLRSCVRTIFAARLH